MPTEFANAMRKCAEFLHTGNLESYHSMKLSYLPKRHAFKIVSSTIMTMLAALQHKNMQKPENLIKSYETLSYSRANKDYVVKTRKVFNTVTCKKAILEEVFLNIGSNTRLGVELSRYFKIALSTLPWTATTWQAASDFSEKVKNVNGAVNFYFVNFYFVDFLLLFIDSYKIINNENLII